MYIAGSANAVLASVSCSRPNPGDQLANAMSNSSIDNLFLDPTRRDPDIGQIAGPREGISASGAGPSMPRPFTSKQHPAADDPFSQLSLSRAPTGERLTLRSILYH